MNPVAILLASYNGSDFLVQQLNSIAVQDECAWVLYARDDGSSDHSSKNSGEEFWGHNT